MLRFRARQLNFIYQSMKCGENHTLQGRPYAQFRGDLNFKRLRRRRMAREREFYFDLFSGSLWIARLRVFMIRATISISSNGAGSVWFFISFFLSPFYRSIHSPIYFSTSLCVRLCSVVRQFSEYNFFLRRFYSNPRLPPISTPALLSWTLSLPRGWP